MTKLILKKRFRCVCSFSTYTTGFFTNFTLSFHFRFSFALDFYVPVIYNQLLYWHVFSMIFRFPHWLILDNARILHRICRRTKSISYVACSSKDAVCVKSAQTSHKVLSLTVIQTSEIQLYSVQVATLLVLTVVLFSNVFGFHIWTVDIHNKRDLLNVNETHFASIPWLS